MSVRKHTQLHAFTQKPGTNLLLDVISDRVSLTLQSTGIEKEKRLSQNPVVCRKIVIFTLTCCEFSETA